MKKLATVPRLLILYAVVWLLFGFLYRQEANLTNGTAFTFNKDVRTGVAVSVIEGQLEEEVSEAVLRSLVENGLPGGVVQEIGDSQGGFTYYALQPMGRYWARYYEELLAVRGSTHFAIEPLPTEAYRFDAASPIYYLSSSFPEVTEAVPSARPYTLRFYSGPNLVPTTERQMGQFTVLEEHKIWLTKPPVNLTIDGGNQVLAYDMVWLPESLRHSLVYLDDSPELVQDAISGTRVFPLADFLYFSAATITALGFGDIAPNNQWVRILVMIEVFLGLVVIGGIVGTLFSESRDPTHSHRRTRTKGYDEGATPALNQSVKRTRPCGPRRLPRSRSAPRVEATRR